MKRVVWLWLYALFSSYHFFLHKMWVHVADTCTLTLVLPYKVLFGINIL